MESEARGSAECLFRAPPVTFAVAFTFAVGSAFAELAVVSVGSTT